MRLVPKRLRWLGLGAVVGWLFDSEYGKERRTRIAEHSAGLLRGAGRHIETLSPSAGTKLREFGDAVDPEVRPDGHADVDRPVPLAAPSKPGGSAVVTS